MKKYVITIAKTFMKDHPRSGEETNFFSKIQSEDKIHTVREGFLEWQRKVNMINAGKAVLVLKEWSGVPYRSTPIVLAQLTKVGIEQMSFLSASKKGESGAVLVVNATESIPLSVDVLSKNDGLTRTDFDAWFTKDATDLAIIHFTDFRYLDNN